MYFITFIYLKSYICISFDESYVFTLNGVVKMEKYLPKYLDEELEDILGYMGVVLIVGPKGVVKRQLQSNVLIVLLNCMIQLILKII